MSPTREAYATLKTNVFDPLLNYQHFSLYVYADSEKAPLKLQMVPLDPHCSEYFMSMFLVFHILDFYKTHVLSSGQISNLITQNLQEVTIFGITECREKEIFQKNPEFEIIKSLLL